MRQCSRWMVALVAVSLVAVPALAQFPAVSGRALTGIMLLKQKQVRTELKVTEEQGKKIDDAEKEARYKFKDDLDKLKELKGGERFRKQIEVDGKINAEANKSLEKILSAEQNKRLHQIELQIQGIGAFMNPEIQKQLDLNDEQKDDVRKLVTDMSKEMQKLAADMQAKAQQGNFEAIQDGVKKLQSLNRETAAKAAKLLKPEQQKKWKELSGAPFELKVELPGFPGGGIRPPGNR